MNPASGAYSAGMVGLMEAAKRIRGRFAWTLAVLVCDLWLWAPCAGRAQSTSEAEKKKEDAGPAKTVKAEDAGQAKAVKTEDEGPAKTVKTYETTNGTQTYSRIEERERKKTADGETVTERVRMKGSDGDDRVLLEREIHTKNLPDGTIERETVLKNPDGNGEMQPIEITREKIRPEKSGSTVEREVEKPDLNGGWHTVQRESERTTGTEASKQTTKEVQQPTVNGDWKPVVRELHWDTKTPDGQTTRTVTQAPDAHGNLTDYEVHTEKTGKGPDGETREVTITRRNSGDTDAPNPVLVEHTVTQEHRTPAGDVISHTTTESDLVNGGAARNLESAHPEIVEEKNSVETKGKDGTTKTTTTVSRRGSAAPDLHPSHKIVEEKDASGHIRQVYIPSQ